MVCALGATLPPVVVTEANEDAITVTLPARGVASTMLVLNAATTGAAARPARTNLRRLVLSPAGGTSTSVADVRSFC